MILARSSRSFGPFWHNCMLLGKWSLLPMARREGSEPLYQAFATFKDRCLLADSSLLWPEAVLWTKQNVTELRRRLIDNPILGAQATFTEKLEDQLRGGPKELWMMIADLYY